MKQEKAVATTGPSSLSVAHAPAFTGLVPSDIIIPKLLLMQGLSEFVTDGKAQVGTIVRSTTGEKLGDPNHMVPFIPLTFPQSHWVIEVKGQTKFEFRRMIPRTSQNDQLPWKFMSDEDGNEVMMGYNQPREARRVQRLSFYALLPQDIDAEIVEKKKAEKGEFPDFSKALMPVMIACKSLSHQAGKEVVSFFTQAASFGRNGWDGVLKIGCRAEQNDAGKFHVLVVDRSKPTPVKPEHKPMVDYWHGVVSTNEMKVDDADETVVASETVPF